MSLNVKWDQMSHNFKMKLEHPDGKQAYLMIAAPTGSVQATECGI